MLNPYKLAWQGRQTFGYGPLIIVLVGTMVAAAWCAGVLIVVLR